MTNNRCADCGKGEVTFQKLSNFETKIRGVPFTVPEAEVGICNACGATFFSPQEVRRWQHLCEAEQERVGRLLSAEEIQNIRKGLGLSIHFFAQLLGTTRQSVYNWERKDRRSPQLRLVDLILRLIRESASSGAVDVVHFLSKETGVDLTPPNRPVECGVLRRRRWRRWRDPAEYDRACHSSGAATALPSLRSY